MSGHDQAAAAILSQIALAADGAVLGLALAYVTVRSFIRFNRTSSALRRISKAPSVRVPDLRSLFAYCSDSDYSEQSRASDGGKLVVVRGVVDAKSAIDGNWTSLRPNVLVSSDSGEKGVILQRTQTCIYHEWRGFLGWTSELSALVMRSWKDQESKSLRMVPFIIVDSVRWPQSDYVAVSMDGSEHPLPLTTVYHQLQPVNATPSTILQAVIGHQYPVGLLDEEKIFPLGKDITAAGVCSLKNGILEIKSCKDLPYFLSDMTKEHMVVELGFRAKLLLWSGIVLGSLSISILGYAAFRNWKKWKEWRHRRQVGRGAHASEEEENEELGEVGDGELCVICLMRRRRSAFIPCGHLVCCPRCALSVERAVVPKCPICRQFTRGAVRIYDS